jgi:2-polyprenyl-6-methoxyphenol hydroxylase-like FAD-dependent oxidoreductase
LPTGLGPRSLGEAELVSLFWSLRCDRLQTWRDKGLDAWKSEVRSLCPETESVLDQIHDPEQVLMATYHDVVMHRWSTRNVVYLGDAAHATSPQLGQGANLALWDAMTLAESLAEVDRDLAHALDRYSRTRRDHLAFYQVATRWLTPFFQGDSALFATLRDTFMPLCVKIPFTKKLMTTSMIGVMNGFGGNTLALDLP